MKQEKTFKDNQPNQDVNFDAKYTHLFEQTENTKGKKKGKKSSKFLGKIVKMNAWPLTLSTLVYILQASPLWVTPLVTSYIINLVTETVSVGAGVGADVWRKIIIASVMLAVLIIMNVPTTTWRAGIISKMCRRTSAGIKCAVVRKLQTLSITYHKDMQMGRIQSKFLKDTDAVDTLLGTFVRTLLPNVVGVIIAVAISVAKSFSICNAIFFPSIICVFI